MASQYLLDTNILSDLVRYPHGRVADRIRAVGEDAVHTSIIVAAEVRFGAVKRGSKALTANVDAILKALPILPFDEPADHTYAQLRAKLAQQGKIIGPNDLLIAAHALSAGMTLVTANTGEFSRVEPLAVENWLP